MAKYVLIPQKLGNYCSLREGLMWIAYRRFPEYTVEDIKDKHAAIYLKFFEDGPLDDWITYFETNIRPYLNDIDGNKLPDDFGKDDDDFDIIEEYLEVFYHKMFIKLKEHKIPLYGLARNVKDRSFLSDDEIEFERIYSDELIYDFIDWQFNEIKDPDDSSENKHYYSTLFIPIEDLLKEFPIEHKNLTTVQEMENLYILDESDTNKISDTKMRGRKKSLSEEGQEALKSFCIDFIKENPNSLNKVIILSCNDWLKNKLDFWLPFSTIRDYVTPIINEMKEKSENIDIQNEN